MFCKSHQNRMLFDKVIGTLKHATFFYSKVYVVNMKNTPQKRYNFYLFLSMRNNNNNDRLTAFNPGQPG